MTDRRDHGFTLPEMALVILLAGLVLSAGTAAYRTVSREVPRRISRARLARLEDALLVYVQKSGRLPCPAAGSCEETGNVPWQALDVPKALSRDGWGEAIRYRVSPSLTREGALSCRPRRIARIRGELQVTDGGEKAAWVLTAPGEEAGKALRRLRPAGLFLYLSGCRAGGTPGLFP